MCVCIIVIIYRDIGSQSFWEIGAPEVQYLFLMKGRAGEFGSGDLVTTELYTELGFRQVSTKRTGNSSASMRKSTVIGRNRVANCSRWMGLVGYSLIQLVWGGMRAGQLLSIAAIALA